MTRISTPRGGWMPPEFTYQNPSGFTWDLPFIIYGQNGVFYPDPDFSLLDYAESQMTNQGVQTYYVSMTGNDADTGLSWGNALRSIWVALNKADVGRVYVGAGYYYRRYATVGNAPAKDCSVIGVGDVYSTGDEYRETGTWSHVGNHYEAANSRTIVKCWDDTNPDAYGDWGAMILCATSGDVDSTPNGWYKSGTGTIYVRTWDDRPPDASLHFMPITTGSVGIANNRNHSIYMSNIHCYGGSSAAFWLSASGTAFIHKIYVEDCTFAYSTGASSQYNNMSLWGITESILFNVTSKQSQYFDGINYKVYGGVIPKGIEYNVESYKHGDGSTDQPSTSHDGTSLVRMMGKYHDCPGVTILADVGAGTKSWNLGCEIYSPLVPATGGAVYTDAGGSIWLEGCNIHDLGTGGKDLNSNAGSAIHYDNLTSGGEFIGAGTLATYTQPVTVVADTGSVADAPGRKFTGKAKQR